MRTQSGASRHMGGSNRTIIKPAQQLIIHPRVNLGMKVPVIFDRFDLAAVPVKGEEAGQLLASANLAGLSAVICGGPGGLNLVHKKGRTYMINLNAPGPARAAKTRPAG